MMCAMDNGLFRAQAIEHYQRSRIDLSTPSASRGRGHTRNSWLVVTMLWFGILAALLWPVPDSGAADGQRPALTLVLKNKTAGFKAW